MTIPFANAALTKVRSPAGGKTVEYESEGADDGPELWTGNAAVYYQEKRERRQLAAGGAGGSISDTIVERYLYVETRTPTIAWKPDLVVEFTTVFGEDVTAEVVLARRADQPDVPSPVATTKLTLKLS